MVPKFQTEEELVQTFITVFRIAKRSPLTVYATEVNCDDGIADVVIGVLNARWCDYKRIAEIPSRWVYPLVTLPYRKAFRVDQFAKITGVTVRHAKNMLQLYQEAGFCKEQDGAWKKIKTPRRPFNNIIAIEAKISDWRGALAQASRYRSYSNQSWVLLDDKSIGAAGRHIADFQHYNVGLASMTSGGRIRYCNFPVPKTPSSPLRYWYCCAELLKRYRPID